MIPGRYIGKIIDYGMGETQKGDPQVLVMFEFKDDEEVNQRMCWFGTLKEGKGRQITIDTLLNCGFKGTELSVLADGVGNGALDTEKELQLTVNENVYNGKKSLRIDFVNLPGGSAFREKMSKEQVVQKFTGMKLDLRADIMQRRQELGVKDTPPTAKTGKVNQVPSEEVPF